jgi:hypothetical protein
VLTRKPQKLKDGRRQNCGCRMSEILSTQKGGTIDLAYAPWNAMITRTTNTNHHNFPLYGGNGLGVCEEWRYDFNTFLAHIGPRPSKAYSIDRIDNTKGYEPGNVRWATKVEQANNRHNTVMVEHEGIVQPISMLARANGICPRMLYTRIVQCNWPIHEALHTPAKHIRNNSAMYSPRPTIRKNTTSGVVGVNWSNEAQKWTAQACHKGKRIFLGRFIEKEDAIAARKAFENIK